MLHFITNVVASADLKITDHCSSKSKFDHGNYTPLVEFMSISFDVQLVDSDSTTKNFTMRPSDTVRALRQNISNTLGIRTTSQLLFPESAASSAPGVLDSASTLTGVGIAALVGQL